MKKLLVFACALAVMGPGITSAQSYPYQNYQPVLGQPVQAGLSAQAGGCINVTSNLSVGSRGSEVTSLQRFLVSQNYPGAGSWMVTGYYGRATEAAVRIFQRERGLPQTSVVDWQTRMALRQSCEYHGDAYAYQNQTYLTYPYQQFPYQQQYTYPYPNQYPPVHTPLRLDSIEPQSGGSGATVTLRGSGFERNVNTVRFDNNAILTEEGENNGTTIELIVPHIPPGIYGVYVTNGRGTSNTVSFTVTGDPNQYYCNLYGPYSYNRGYNYPYNYLPAQIGGYNYGYQHYSYPYGCY